MKVLADRSRCCGGGQCVLAAPEVFDQDEQGLVRVLQSNPPPSLAAAVRAAVESCPSRCISIEADPGSAGSQDTG